MLIFGTGSIAGSILSGQIAEHARHGVLTAFLITATIAVLACFIVIIGVNSCRDIEMDL
ncbi:MAG: hypothetical protein R3C45_22265 [Phycisphaerales bacterium]